MQQPPETSGDLREELRGDAQKLTSTAAERLQSEADARKGPAVEQARSVASALNKAAEIWAAGKVPAGSNRCSNKARSRYSALPIQWNKRIPAN